MSDSADICLTSQKRYKINACRAILLYNGELRQKNTQDCHASGACYVVLIDALLVAAAEQSDLV